MEILKKENKNVSRVKLIIENKYHKTPPKKKVRYVDKIIYKLVHKHNI